MMTKLDDLLDESGLAFMYRDSAKLEIKILMLKTFSKALEAKSVEEMAEIFRKEVEAL